MCMLRFKTNSQCVQKTDETLHYCIRADESRPIKMDPHIGSLWLLTTCVGIVMLSCYISGVACDVPDDVVYTDLHKMVRFGDSIVLKCQFRGTPLAVNWKKGDDPIRAPNLVSWIPGDPVTGTCVRERLCQIMEMNAEFSLIIKEVSIVEQGRYICTVANYKGNQIHNFTDISVFSPPKEPYPIINECQMISPNDTETTCTISTSQSVEISCSASGYFPDIDLYFLHGSIRLYTKETIEVTNLDGTKIKTVSAIATASEISYMCFASIPGSEEQRKTTVLVNLRTSSSPMPAGPSILIDKTDGSVAKVVVPVIFIILLAVICISIILLRRRWKQQRIQGPYAKVPPVGKIDVTEEYKSELTDEVLTEFALNISKRHCQKLGKTLKLSARAIANRNEEDLEMFRTDIMLKEWVMDQQCSNHEIRRRLRQAAEQCNRQDIADIFIRKEQSEVMTSTIQLQAGLTITNEKQSPGASGSESVSSVSRDELYRIGRYAGSKILRAFCEKYDVTEVPGQQSPEGKELLLEIINVLKPKLDSEFERIKKEKKPNTPRKTLRQLLEKEHPRYACLLAMKKTVNIFNVELIDLAYRLIMADVYPFAKALNISDQVLNAYRGDLGPHNLTQGTANTCIMKQVYTDNRIQMVNALRQAGYSEEARALYYGFEISVGDVIEVENRVDMAQLAKQLGVPDDVQSTGPDNQVKDDRLHQSVILRWRDTVCSSTFNHRLELADALFSMGKEQLALDIISGVYRNGVINDQVLKLLEATVSDRQEPIFDKFLHQKRSKWKSPTELSNKLLGAGFYVFAHEIMAGGWEEGKKVRQKEGTETGTVATEELRQGGIAINVSGEKGGKEEKEGKEKATNSDTLVDNTDEEGTRKGEVREKDLEPVAMPKDNETKPTEGIQEANTSEEGEGSKHGKEYNKASEEEASINKNGTDGEQISIVDEVMQEKSGDGAAESKENTTENVDTMEQDGLAECRGDESSKLLIQARA